jgi:hypothetical protein
MTNEQNNLPSYKLLSNSWYLFLRDVVFAYNSMCSTKCTAHHATSMLCGRCNNCRTLSYPSHHPLTDDAYLTVGRAVSVTGLGHAGVAVVAVDGLRATAAAEAAQEAAAAGGLNVLLGAPLAAAAEPEAEAGGEEEDDAADDDADESTASETPAAAAVASGLAGDDGSVLNDGSD